MLVSVSVLLNFKMSWQMTFPTKLHSALPCEGHMDAALHIMAYLGLHHNSRLCMDPTYQNIDNDQFPVIDLKENYGEVA